MNYQLLQWLKQTFIGDDFEDNLMLQDFILPIQHLKDAIILNDALTGIYPVWLVPSRFVWIKSKSISITHLYFCNVKIISTSPS